MNRSADGRGSFVVAAILVLQAASAARVKKKRHRPAPAPVVSVTPGRDIETQIVAEVARAENILNELRPDNAFDSPYLLSAVYYHDGLLDKFPEDRAKPILQTGWWRP